MQQLKQDSIHVQSEGQGEALSLMHGWGMNAAVFEPLSHDLTDQFAVSRVDLPGHGGSQWHSGDESVDKTFQQQVKLLAETLPDSTLLGWSMGGLYALKLANLYPERFKRLILVASNPCFVQRENWSAAVKATVFDGFAEGFVDNWQATIRRFLGLQMFGVDNARQHIRTISELLYKGGAPHPDALRFGLQLLLSRDARDQIIHLQVPLLVILGRRDKLVPAALARELTRLNPNIRVECLPHSAHAPFLSHLDDFTGLVREFIKPAASG